MAGELLSARTLVFAPHTLLSAGGIVATVAAVAAALLVPLLRVSAALASRWAALTLTADDELVATLPSPVAAAVDEIHLRLATGFFVWGPENAPASLSQPQLTHRIAGI